MHECITNLPWAHDEPSNIIFWNPFKSQFSKTVDYAMLGLPVFLKRMFVLWFVFSRAPHKEVEKEQVHRIIDRLIQRIHCFTEVPDLFKG